MVLFLRMRALLYACVYVVFHLGYVLSLGLRSSHVSWVRGYIWEAITEAVVIATKVEPAIGTLARWAFFCASIVLDPRFVDGL